MTEPWAGPDDVLYHREGDRVQPTELAQGPWDPRAQHGGPVSALLADAIERVEPPAPMRVTRLTVELMRSVPLTELLVRTTVLRTGRKVQLVEAVLTSDDVEVARAVGLSVRAEPGLIEFDPTRHEHAADELPAARGDVHPFADPTSVMAYVPGFMRAVTMQRSVGMHGEGGVAEVWCRLHCAVVDDRELTPLVRAAALADFTSGLGNSLDFTRYTSINPDVTMQLWRYPVGEWIGLRATTKLNTDGIGTSESSLFDDDGRFGNGLTSLVLQPR